MRSFFLLVSFILLSFVIFAQSDSNKNNSKFSFGFNIGANYSNLQFNKTIPNNAEIYNDLGFSLGLFMDYEIFNNFLVSPKIELAFYNSGVEFENADNSTYRYDVFPMSLNFMTHLVYKIGNKKYVPYILLGPNVKIPISKRPRSSSEFYTGSDLAIDFGVGLENKTKCFIFSPELRYSYGLFSINQHPNIQYLGFNNISLILNFK